MKKKFVRVMFFGALALSTVTYVGCKDYDDDINNLQTQIDANKASIADLQKFVDAGKWVKSVEDITGGFKLTFSDGKAYSIVNGATGAQGDKGDKGDQGAQGGKGDQGLQGIPGTSSTLTVDPVTGEWKINNELTGWSAKSPYIQDGFWYTWSKADGQFVKGDKATGENGADGIQGPQGLPGADAFSPYIADGTNGDKGYWYFYQKDHAQAITSGALKGWVKGPLTDTSISLTKSTDKPCWILKQQISEGNWSTVILPTADNLTSIKGVMIDGNNKITTDGTKVITLYYGTASATVKFGDPEVTYEKDALLTSNSAVINAMVNPTDIDLSQYTIKLQDSHGNSCYTLSAPDKNMSSTPLARAAAEEKWNQGIYDLTVSLAEGLEADQIKAGAAYALATKNAWDKTILSDYDVQIVPSTNAQSLAGTRSVDVPFNELQELDQILIADGETNLGNVVDYYYEFSALPATVTFDKAKNTIISTIGQTVTGTLHYLRVDGTIDSSVLTLNFKSIPPVVAVSPMNWTIGTPDATAQVTLPAEIKTLLDNPSRYSLDYANGTGTALSTPGAGDIAFSSTDPVMVDGNPVNYNANSIILALTDNGLSAAAKIYYLTPTFNDATVTATAHIVKLVVRDNTGTTLLGTDIVKTINLTVNVKQDNSILTVFKPLTAFFDAAKKNAKGYGKPNLGNTNVEYDLYTLFEAISSTDKANITFETGTWTNASSIVEIPYADISFGTTIAKHDLTIVYQPFANTNLSKIEYPFTLAVWSEIERGTHGTVTNKLLSEVTRTFALKTTDFTWKDYKAAAITLATESRITGITLKLSEEAEKYMKLDHTDFKTNTTINVTMLDNITSVETEIPGTVSYITMSVKDAWGVTTSVEIPVPIKKI